jgi:DtxR family transcriptional regulator, Mn-dependent transcriptional regulator
MQSQTVEDYLKAIYHRSATSTAPISTGELAQAVGVSPGTVTSMLKTLAEAGLVTYVPYEGVRLTDSGGTLALRILRRHRLIELFLVKTLELSWDEVHEEAEGMEHAVSDLLIDRVDALLGYPKVDPHGDPIPSPDGAMESLPLKTLAQCEVGDAFRLVRVLDQAPEFLRFLTESGLPLGAQGRVVSIRRESGVVTVAVGDREATLGLQVAEKLLISDA